MKEIVYKYKFWPRGVFIYLLPNVIFPIYIFFIFNPLVKGWSEGSVLFVVIYLIYLVWVTGQLVKGNYTYSLTDTGLVYPYFIGPLYKKDYFIVQWNNVTKGEAVKCGTKSKGGFIFCLKVSLVNLEELPKPLHGSIVKKNGAVSLVLPNICEDLKPQIEDISTLINEYRGSAD